MSTVIPLPRPVLLPVAGSLHRFPVRRVYCVGRNYAAHAIEMGHDPSREPPFFFQKYPDNLVGDGDSPYPVLTNDVHHEVKLAVALKASRLFTLAAGDVIMTGTPSGVGPVLPGDRTDCGIDGIATLSLAVA